jgi:hypothetical protein
MLLIGKAQASSPLHHALNLQDHLQWPESPVIDVFVSVD